MKILFALLPFVASAFSTSAVAAGAENYDNLAALAKTSFYRLTCSDTASEIQVHGYVEVSGGKPVAFKIYTLKPALSVDVTEFSKKDLGGLKVSLSPKALVIDGGRAGAYYDETVSIEVKDGAQGLEGTFSYNDGDGVSFSRSVRCGAVNYILKPNN